MASSVNLTLFMSYAIDCVKHGEITNIRSSKCLIIIIELKQAALHTNVETMCYCVG